MLCDSKLLTGQEDSHKDRQKKRTHEQRDEQTGIDF